VKQKLFPKNKAKEPGTRLFKAPNPLDKRIEEAFFAEAPLGPGLCFFESESGELLYVEETPNLNKRLNQYRLAPLLEVAPKARKLLFATRKLRWETCSNSGEARSRAQLLVKKNPPVFNAKRSHTESLAFLCLKYKAHNKRLHLSLLRTSEEGGDDDDAKIYGAFHRPGKLPLVYASLIRLLWYSAEAEKKSSDFDTLPAQIFRRRPPLEFRIRVEAKRLSQIHAYFSGIRGSIFLQELHDTLPTKFPKASFHYKIISRDLLTLKRFYESTLSYSRRLENFQNLGKKAVPKKRIED